MQPDNWDRWANKRGSGRPRLLRAWQHCPRVPAGPSVHACTAHRLLTSPALCASPWTRCRRAQILGNVTKFVDEYNTLLCEYQAAKVGAWVALCGCMCSRGAGQAQPMLTLHHENAHPRRTPSCRMLPAPWTSTAPAGPTSPRP